MKTLIHILLTILFAATCTSVIAQTDTLKGLPLYRNAQAEKIEGEQSIVRSDPYANDTIGIQLRQLQSLYSAGKFHDALKLSRTIRINPHLNKEQNQDRLKYTIATYKDLGYDREADSLTRIFRQRDPFYQPRSIDPVSFKNVMNNYYTKSKFSIWLAFAKNIADAKLETVRSIVDTMSKDPEYDIDAWMVQLGFEYRPLKIISVSLAPAYSKYKMQRAMPRSELATFRCKEQINVIKLPLIVEAGLFMGKERFVPSIYGGAQLKYIINSKYKAYTDAIGSYTVIPDDKDNVDTKNRLNYSVLGGVRFNYNHRRMTFFADLGIAYDLYPFNDTDKRLEDSELVYQFFYVPDVFRLLEYSFKVGVKVNLQYKTIAKHNYGY